MRNLFRRSFSTALLAGAALTLAGGASATTLLMQDFESMPLGGNDCATPYSMSEGWSNASGDGTDWLVDAGSTPSFNTGPPGDHSQGGSGQFAYVEASGCVGAIANLDSPVIDLSGITGTSLSFAYHMTGTAMGSLHFDASTDGGASFVQDIAAPIVGDQGPEWLVRAIDLSAYDGIADFVFRFRALVGSSFSSDIAIDSIEFSGDSSPAPVPEPGTLGLLGLGLAGLAWRGRARA